MAIVVNGPWPAADGLVCDLRKMPENVSEANNKNALSLQILGTKPNARVVTSQPVLWRHTSSNAKIINTPSSLLFSQIMAEIDIWVRFFPSAQIQHQVAGPLLGFSFLLNQEKSFLVGFFLSAIFSYA
jgi:hypothetical protein